MSSSYRWTRTYWFRLCSFCVCFVCFLNQDSLFITGLLILCFVYYFVLVWLLAPAQSVPKMICYLSSWVLNCTCSLTNVQGGTIKTVPPSHCKYSEIPWPNCVEIGERLQYYMLNTVINILFKNFIVLWRHLAKTQIPSFIHIVQIDLSITQ